MPYGSWRGNLQNFLDSTQFLIFDKTIEVLPHYSLSSRARFSSLGWAPDDIQVHFQNEKFDASQILERIGGRMDFDPPNGRKFCLVDRSLAGTDTDLSLSLKETDYFTIRSVLSKLTYDLRKEFGSLDPAVNRIPHSLCLHFLVRCGDGNVVCLLNERRKAYAGGTWSVSAEEQLKDSDLDMSYPLAALFRRALLEEIFGLSDDTVPLSNRWARIEDLVVSMRLWSVFVEDHISNFSLLGVYQLSLNTDHLRGRIKEFINDGSAARDLEGKLYVASQGELENLLISGSSAAVGLFSGEPTSVLSENLHWTARYRIFRLLRALKGGPLVPEVSTSARGGA